jgi:hypothetical protein
MTAPSRHLQPGVALAARRSGRLHRCLAAGRGLPAALSAYPAGPPPSAVAAPGLSVQVRGWSVREQRIGRGASLYVFRRSEATRG